MSVVALNNNTRPKHSLKTSYLIKLWVPSKKHTLLYAGMSVHACAVCAPTLGTGAPLFKVSPWALKLWQRTRRGPPPTPPLSLQHPSQPQKILPELPRGEAEGKRDLEERGESTTTTAASKSQQPGEGLWVIFYGRRGTADVHLFISTVSIEVCVHASVCVCVTRSVIAHFILTQDRARGHQSLCRVPRPVTPQRVMWRTLNM